ncbi:MAG: FAD-dependent oxidoreductase [Chitinophagales bacterium]
MLSFWEKSSFLHYNYLIVGGGIVGFSTAIELKKKNPKASVLVVEAGLLPTGASTKNAGFACVGSLSEMLADLENHSEEELIALSKLRWEGLNLLRKNLGDKNMDYQASGSHELLFEHELPLLDQIPKLNQILAPNFGENTFSEKSLKEANFGFSSDVKALVFNQVEGSLHTGKMMKNLILKAQSLGVEYKTLAKVNRIEEDSSSVHVFIEGQEFSLTADNVVLCTNAFTKTFLPDLDLEPGRGQVLVTEKIPNLKLKGIYHFDSGYYYFREIEGRVLFGGGRNMDFEAEKTNDFALNSKIQQDLETKLKTLICPKHEVKIAMRWTGIMAFGRNKLPFVERLSQGLWAGVRLGGMGVAIGSKLGEILSSKLLEEGN